MQTLLTIAFIVSIPVIVSGQDEHDLRLRYCLEGKAHGAVQIMPPIRASADGVVICATAGDDKKNTQVVTIVNDVLDTFSIHNRQLTQGVVVDSLIFFCVFRSDSSVAEYNPRTKKMEFYKQDNFGDSWLPVLISSFGSNIVMLDLYDGPMIVNRERKSFEMLRDGWQPLDVYEVFGIRDSTFALAYGSSVVIPHSRRQFENFAPSVDRVEAKVSVVGDLAMWMDPFDKVWSFSRTTRILDSFQMFERGQLKWDMASVGKNGVLTATRNEVDSTIDELTVSYYSFNKSIVRHNQIFVCSRNKCRTYYFDGIGWSNGTFYLTVASPDSMMCVYSYKEPEPITNVKIDSRFPSTLEETALLMNLPEFGEWRRGLSAAHELYDLYGNNITCSVIGVGVVFVVFDNFRTRVLVVP